MQNAEIPSGGLNIIGHKYIYIYFFFFWGGGGGLQGGEFVKKKSKAQIFLYFMYGQSPAIYSAPISSTGFVSAEILYQIC